MKHVIVVFCSMLAASCQPVSRSSTSEVSLKDTVFVHDTIQYVTSHPCDTVITYVSYPDSNATKAMKRQRDSVIQALYVTKYKVQRVKYYISITKKNPNNRAFLLGWVKRAVQ